MTITITENNYYISGIISSIFSRYNNIIIADSIIAEQLQCGNYNFTIVFFTLQINTSLTITITMNNYYIFGIVSSIFSRYNNIIIADSYFRFLTITM